MLTKKRKHDGWEDRGKYIVYARLSVFAKGAELERLYKKAARKFKGKP
jgi:hypothetical protein